MKELTYTLICDGSSDRAFMPILDWLLKDLGIDCNIQGEWADFTRLPKPPKSLSEKIAITLELYPCNLLFVHRDAEKESRQIRIAEIECAAKAARITDLPLVCVIPIRMLEAWLLFDESAIRSAAANPNGKCQLKLPATKEIENISDPKSLLFQLLRDASELKGRRLNKFNQNRATYLLAQIIDDFTPLHNISAFQDLKSDLSDTLHSQGWL